jgi:hypothetical protein
MRLLGRYPIWSGVLFGILTIKPQLGLLVPVALIAAGAWGAIASAAVTAGLMMAGSVALFGIEPWISYFHVTMPFQQQFLERGVGVFTYMMPTSFMAARQMGWGIETGYILNALTAVVAVIAVAWCYRNKSLDQDLRLAIFATATFLASPYAFNYDLTIVTAALMGLLAFQRPQRPHPAELPPVVAMWALPLLMLTDLPGDEAFHSLYGPVILSAMLIYLLARANAFSFDFTGGRGER